MNGKNGKPVIILISLILISTWTIQQLQGNSTIRISYDERKGEIQGQIKEKVQELHYDDGIAEFGFVANPGVMGAVRFTPSEIVKPVKLKFYVWGEMKEVAVHLLDSNFDAVFTKRITPYSGWFEVDISSVEIFIEEEFYIGFQWLTESPHGPWLGVDTTPPHHSRSYLGRPGSRGDSKSGEDYLIRVEYKISQEEIRIRANTLFQEGVQLFTSGEYSQAIKKFEEAEELFKSIPVTSEAVRCREYQKRSEAEHNLELGENISSEYWISHALALFQELEDDNGVVRCKRALAKIYLDQGRELFYQEKYQKAKQELEEGLTLYSELSDSSGENFCSSLIAEIDDIFQKQEEAAANFATAQQYLETGDYSNAITYAQTAKALYIKLQMENQAECDQLIVQAEQELKKRNQIIIGVAGVLSVFGIGTGVYILKKRKPGRLQELELNLKNLNEMLEKGLISEKEFEIAKKEIEDQKKKLLKEQ